MMPADTKYTTCHDDNAVMKLAAGRDSITPIISPEVTLPTARPRVAGGARCPA
jgi:hypothetical protein